MNDCLHARTPVHLLISHVTCFIWCDTQSMHMLHRSEAVAEAAAIIYHPFLYMRLYISEAEAGALAVNNANLSGEYYRTYNYQDCELTNNRVSW